MNAKDLIPAIKYVPTLMAHIPAVVLKIWFSVMTLSAVSVSNQILHSNMHGCE